MNPTYTFVEIIEQIRTCEDPALLEVIARLVESEKHRYCLFHNQLILTAFKLRLNYFKSQMLH